MNSNTNPANYTFKYHRVTVHDPCPICGKIKWCSVRDDGALAVCMWESTGAIKATKDGKGWVHVLQDIPFNQGHSSPGINRPPAQQSERKNIDIEKYHAAYEALLSTLTLNSEHGDDLLARGLDETTITQNLYSSIPQIQYPGRSFFQGDQNRARQITAELQKQGIDVTGIPGFYRCPISGAWTFNVRSLGFLVPYRDVEGRIQGAQIRLDRPFDGKTRYLWFSTNPNFKDDRTGNIKYPEGTSSATQIHFARPWHAESTGEAIITEGALKADVIAELQDECVIGLPGFDNFSPDFPTWLKEQLPNLTYIAIAFDQDDDPEKRVRTEKSAWDLIDSLTDAGIQAEKLGWPEGTKGYDDFLKSQQQGGN
jgi:uncharacterized protein DUF3854